MISRVLLSRWMIAGLNLLICVPLGLAIGELGLIMWKAGWSADHAAIHSAEELIEGMGVVLIGWGVAMEERDGVEHLLGGARRPGDAYEAHVDMLCHDAGLALLLMGLFAEIAMECEKLPDSVINTSGIEWIPLGVSTLLLAGGLYCLAATAVRLMLMRKPAG